MQIKIALMILVIVGISFGNKAQAAKPHVSCGKRVAMSTKLGLDNRLMVTKVVTAPIINPNVFWIYDSNKRVVQKIKAKYIFKGDTRYFRTKDGRVCWQ